MMLCFATDAEVLTNDCDLATVVSSDGDVVVRVTHPSGERLQLSLEVEALVATPRNQVWAVDLFESPSASDAAGKRVLKRPVYVSGAAVMLLVGVFCSTSSCSGGHHKRRRLLRLASIHRAEGNEPAWADVAPEW